MFLWFGGLWVGIGRKLERGQQSLHMDTHAIGIIYFSDRSLRIRVSSHSTRVYLVASSWKMRAFIASVSVFLQALLFVSCDIIPYKDDIIYPQHPAYLSVPKFAPKDAPHWSPGNGNSFIGTYVYAIGYILF